MAPINLLKAHMFTYYTAFSSIGIFTTAFFRTYTDASYGEIGTMSMLCSVITAFTRPMVCSLADRRLCYKKCLLGCAICLNLSTILMALLPFFPNLGFDEPHPRFIFWLVAINFLFMSNAIGLIITLNDVFAVHKCLNSGGSEYYGQYRFTATLGWTTSSICLAVIENYTILPYLSLPYVTSFLMTLIDIAILAQLNNIKRKPSLDIMVASNEHLAKGAIVTPIELKQAQVGSGKGFNGSFSGSNGIVDSQRVADSSGAGGEASKKFNTSIVPIGPLNIKTGDRAHNGLPPKVSISNDGGRQSQIGLRTQVGLLIRLNRHDNYNLVKYLLLFVLLGAVQQVHYVFYFQFITDILKSRSLLGLLFTMNAMLQIGEGVGETMFFLWLGRRVTDAFGRDIVIIMCLLLSGLRFAIYGFLIEVISIWFVGLIEVASGFVFAASYTIMVETASCYLSMLDRLILVDNDSGSADELEFTSYLEQLKESYSIEKIRFALKATIQSIFSSAFEGLGFALGPLVAGLWIHSDGSLWRLYEDMTWLHLYIITGALVLEWAVLRLIFGAHSKVDRLILVGSPE